MSVKDIRVILDNEVNSLFKNYGKINLDGLTIINNFQNKQCFESIVDSDYPEFSPSVEYG